MEHGIESRPTQKELEERGILKQPGLAPALVAKAEELERERKKGVCLSSPFFLNNGHNPLTRFVSPFIDALEHGIEQRPTQKELEEKGILKHSGLAPSLVAKAEELERERAKGAMFNLRILGYTVPWQLAPLTIPQLSLMRAQISWKDN